jgi:hypothetical protein
MSVDISGHSKKRGNTKSRSDQQSNRRNHSGFRDLRKRALAASFSAAISDYQTAAGGGRSNPWMTQTTRKFRAIRRSRSQDLLPLVSGWSGRFFDEGATVLDAIQDA